MTESLVQKTLNDPLADTTLVLACITAIAVVVPIIMKIIDAREAKQSARHQILALLPSLTKSLGEAIKEPAWSAAAGADLVISRLLQPDILASLPPSIAEKLVSVVMQTHRALHDDERREMARRTQNEGIFNFLKGEANVARKKILDLREQITKLR